MQAFLAATGQGRARGKSPAELRDAVDTEIADVICHALLLAHHRGTDVRAAINRKWLHRNDTPTDTASAQSAEADHDGREANTPVWILDRAPTVTEYRQLRAAVGWNTPCTETCASALAASLFGVVAEIDGTAAGMARVIGDGVYATVVDVVVVPQHQHQRIGVAMMTRINQWAATSAIPHIGLVADDSVATWYQQWPLQPTGDYLRFPAPTNTR